MTIIKQLKEIKDELRAIKDANGELKENKCDIVNILNRQFKSVFIEDNNSSPSFDSMNVEREFEWDIICELSRDTVLKRLKELEVNKACGDDGMRANVLKKASEGFAYPLSLIFRMSLCEGMIPSKWRIANVCPIFKNGNKLDPNNYRPISLTSVPSKILESIV